MASVHKDPRGKSKYWYCAFTLPDGRRAFRSTKATDRSEAVAIGERWERQSTSIAQSPKLQNKAFVMESFISLTQQASQGDFTEATARSFLDDILKASGQAPLRNISARQFLLNWVESKEIAKAKGTGQRYRKVVESFVARLGERADSALGGITPQDVQSFRDEELKLGKANKTANLAVKTLRIALNSARRQGLILTNPAEVVDHLPDNSAERGTFTSEQIYDLLKMADEEWRGMILVASTCGLRLGDAAGLSWANIDFERKAIRFRQQKKSNNAKQRDIEVPILPDLEAYLLALPVKSKDLQAALFPTLSRKPTTGSVGLSNTFTRLITKAGIMNEDASEKREGKGRVVRKLSFHALRHTYISIMANIGVAKELRMKLAGHTSNVHDRYTHHELETYREALKEFPSFTKLSNSK